jgi:asparagine synthase (glutamine-hydrolysing)
MVEASTPFLHMCGIAGFFWTNRSAPAGLVKAMCDEIRHRGPDDEGYYVDGGCALGMRRLSIIDLATGHQPIANEDRSVWIVFNGEIYKYRELREDLERDGHEFRTHTDTETIIHLYEEYGAEALTRLRGMFALAIWDARRGRLLLARDRFGKKPLYYSIRPEGIYFASELSCLRQTEIPLDPDPEALRLYFQFNYIPDPYSAYRAVRRLPAGSWLAYDRDGTVTQGRYWTPPIPAINSGPHSQADTAATIRRTFDESVRIRMIADVPLGAFLSGGIDSSSVVASMALQSQEPIRTFSIGFEESAFNELPFAQMVAKKYKTDHHEIVVRPDSVSLVQKLVDHFGEPFGDSSAIPTYIVSEFAARHVKVALSGDGGDELFGGYESFLAVNDWKRLDRIPQFARHVLHHVANLLPYSAYGKNYLRMISRPNALERYFEFNYAPYFLRTRLLEPGWMLPADVGFLRRTFAANLLPEGADILSQAMYFEGTANLTGDMLVKVDRMSMANSLEVRCPLLDHELAAAAASVPHAWKISNGGGKRILLQALGDRLPKELLSRSKMGFGVPLAVWFRNELREMLWDHLTSESFRGRGIAVQPFVRKLLEEHQSGRRDNNQWLWSLLMLEMWFQKTGRPAPVLP